MDAQGSTLWVGGLIQSNQFGRPPSRHIHLGLLSFGGFKKGGVGCEGVREAVRDMTQPKNTIINIADLGPYRKQRRS